MDQLDFDRLLDAMPDAVLVADMESRIVRLAMLAEPSMADIPVAIVSAFTEGDMSSLRASAVIQKPFHLADIVELAERHCGGG